ncbi:hypothetical protein [Corallococcus aberystwythensis]|uniref:CN hydrolase domain-containing protein n=1 Tax=Corallococcus aberystwythensis TaxID=2316722 RepID=A0A3A8R4Q1_9BACT|nr:hypothetical protein [Corallococcus aberystwythensis]RKH74180.1 hypothetical protein D7W81_02495 [Corallococcus aberystwythensis]
MPIRIGFWNCNLGVNPYWEERPLTAKFAALKQAVAQFSLRCNPGSLSIFTAPEYAFAAKGKGRPLPAEPLPVALVSQYFTAMEKLSATYPRILIVPGSLVVETDKKVQNRVIGYFGGESEIFVGKQHGVGEVGVPVPVGGYTFQPGNGGQVVTLNGVSIFTQICRDATQGTTPDPTVDIHLTIGQGVGVEAIVKKRPNVALIVADAFNYAVVDENGPIDSDATDETLGVKTYCYTVG